MRQTVHPAARAEIHRVAEDRSCSLAEVGHILVGPHRTEVGVEDIPVDCNLDHAVDSLEIGRRIGLEEGRSVRREDRSSLVGIGYKDPT